MLVLSRKQHELIRIGQDIVVKVIRTGRNSVKIGIEAPPDYRIARDDLPGNSEPDLNTADVKQPAG